MKDFSHIHKVLTENGYPESHNSEWVICIEEYKAPQIIRHWYDCGTKAKAKIAVKSLLNLTDVYEVKVHSPHRNVISFHGKFNELSEHEWNYYFN